ncbi:MAG: hypothetical protein LBR73_09580 [Oscillospiraceae bacterium]|jgi:hypothetical protein|nr:hypothetical protein [Oscillospiraceae bacterium]
MKPLRRFTAVLLTLLLTVGLLAPASVTASAADYAIDPNPTILIHGILQSDVYLYNTDGTQVLDSNGNPIQNFPPADIDVGGLLAKAALPLLGSLLLQCDIGLSSAVRACINDVLSVMQYDDEGRHINDFRVHSTPNSLADSSAEDKAYIYGTLPMRGLADLIGEEKLYFYAYNSFGNLHDIVEELYDMILRVQAEHQSEKVNLVPISMGGVLFNALIEFHPDVADILGNVVITIGAINGSRIVGDLFTNKLSTDDVNLYYSMFTSLIKGYMGHLVNLLLRLLPKRVVLNVFDAVVEGLVGDVLSKCTMLWGLVPAEDYEEASAMWLSDPSRAAIKAQTDAYQEARVNARANIKALQDQGVHVYAISEWNWKLYAIVSSYDEVNSDGIIDMNSTSLGATSGYVDTPLPEDYVPSDPERVSPDGIVDAGTGTLPLHTWYFKNQNHEATGRCMPIINLVIRLVSSAAYEDVTTTEWGQFTEFDPVPAAADPDILETILDYADRFMYHFLGAKGYSEFWKLWM